MYQLSCPLGHTLEIGAEHFGARLMCPLCQAVVYAWPPKFGETTPAAKYEAMCDKGHILRVKQKYLGKEIRCPSCQELVSMKPRNLLNSEGKRLGEANPEAFKKKKKQAGGAASSKKKKSTPPPPVQVRISEPTTLSARIPPPPQIPVDDDSGYSQPRQPHVVEEDTELSSRAAQTISGVTVPDEDFEFEVVDTQFNIEIKEMGLDLPGPASGGKTKQTEAKEKQSDKKPPPPSVAPMMEPPPVRRQPPPAPAASGMEKPSGDVLTGLSSLSESEMMKVHHAALDAAETRQPDPQKMVQFNCPQGHLLEVESKHRGSQIQCPTCQSIFTLPK